MAGTQGDKLLGVRDGFLRLFHDGLGRPVPVAIVPQEVAEEHSTPLPLTDTQSVELARRRAAELERRLGETYGFYLGVEAGLSSLEVAGETRHLVRCWTVLRGLGGETWGSSGGVQLPTALIDGLDGAELPFAMPGLRRSDGMVSSLTGGLETRRRAVALATFHALSTAMYGLVESRGPRPYRRP